MHVCETFILMVVHYTSTVATGGIETHWKTKLIYNYVIKQALNNFQGRHASRGETHFNSSS